MGLRPDRPTRRTGETEYYRAVFRDQEGNSELRLITDHKILQESLEPIDYVCQVRKGSVQAANPQNFRKSLADVCDYWSPRVIAQVNDQYVKVAKLKGQLAWHKHDKQDEMFLVVYGSLVIELENERLVLKAGDFCVVPKGTLHNPVAEEECGIVLIETVSTLHTGDVQTPMTKSIESQLAGR